MKAFPSRLFSAFGLIKLGKPPNLIKIVIENESDGFAFAHTDENKKER